MKEAAKSRTKKPSLLWEKEDDGQRPKILFFPSLREGKLTAKGRKKFFSQGRSEKAAKGRQKMFFASLGLSKRFSHFLTIFLGAVGAI